MSNKGWSLKDEILSAPRGNKLFDFEVNGKKGRFMVMDPSTNDVQWYRSEFLKANPDKQRKQGIIGLPSEIIPEIIIRSVCYPIDYGQNEPEKGYGADPALAGQPVFDRSEADAIGDSTMAVFKDIADYWINRINELYPFQAGENAGN